MPQALLARVGLDQLELLGGPPRETQVAQRLRVDREDRAGGAELGRHVADRRAVGERQAGEAGAVELDELAHHAPGAQLLGDGQHQVGGGRPLAQRAVQAEADDLRDQHRHRLAEHRRLGLDPADAPAEHAEPVDHRRVRVGADERVGVGGGQAGAVGRVRDEHHAREVLEVDLVHDPGVGGHDLEVVERLLAPAQEEVALLVALELARGVEGEGVARAEGVDLHGVVDHELGRRERVDAGGVAALLGHRVAHRREVHDGGDAGEVLHQHARGRERDLLGGLRRGVPAGERLDVGGADRTRALGAQQVLEQHLQRERQSRHVEARLERVETEDLVLAPTDGERALRVEAVVRHSPSQSEGGDTLRDRAGAASSRRAPMAGDHLRPGGGWRSGGEFDAALARALAAQQRLVTGLQQLRVGHPGAPLGDADRGADARRETEGGISARRCRARAAACAADSRSAAGRITANSSPP